MYYNQKKRMRKLLLVENQFYMEMEQARRNFNIRNHVSRVKRVEATHRIREFIYLLNEEGDVLMFLRRAGHTMDGYMQLQVGPRLLDS